jgi:mevalonate kinase
MISRATAPAKIILFGEHAVVYNQPAIAIPISNIRAQAEIETSLNPGVTIIAGDLGEMIPVNIDIESVDNALAQTVRLVLQRLEIQPQGLVIHLHSQIPMASGMGSGAAVSTALARALSEALGHPLENDVLNEIIYEVEKMHHGTPSGIDNTVIVYERPVYYVREQDIKPVIVGTPFHLIIGDTGQGALTKIAVGAVRALLESDPVHIQPVIEQIGELTRLAQEALEEGDFERVGSLMNENHSLLQTLTVSSPELDHLVQAARDAGALGAKLSGGGRGGNMIALVTPDTAEQVKTAIMQAGAVRIFETTLE